MIKIKYTFLQIKELSKNKYIAKYSEKYITFTKECKLKVLELDKQWIFHRNIFKMLWFPEYITNSRVTKLSLDRWRNILKNKWLSWFEESKKWRKKKEKIDLSKMNLKEQNIYLKTKIAYLEELHKSIYWDYP